MTNYSHLKNITSIKKHIEKNRDNNLLGEGDLAKKWMRSSQRWMRSSQRWMRSSRVWMRSCQVVDEIYEDELWMKSSRVVNVKLSNCPAWVQYQYPPTQCNLRVGR
jgi:hypothetical protein